MTSIKSNYVLAMFKLKIHFNNTGHDNFIDFLKGFAILCVILTHSIPVSFQKYILFPFWGAQAVPIFIIIQSYHFFKSENPDIPLWKFKKILKKIFLPFFIVTFAEILLLLSFGQSPVAICKKNIVYGGIGPGSYFPWIYLQISIVLPIFLWIFKRIGLHKWVVSIIICILISELLEIISIFLHVPEWLYRLLAFRYVFLIYLGYVWAKQGISINVKSLMLSGLSVIFIVLLDYTDTSLPFLFPAWANHHWICFFYCACLLTVFLYDLYHRIASGLKGIVCQIGKGSYEVFLAQMFVFTILELILPIIGVCDKTLKTLIIIVSSMILSILPVLFIKKYR